MATSRDLLNSTLTSKFDMGRFQEFIIQFFNNSKIIDPSNKRQDYWNWNEYSYYVNGFFHVAEYTDPNRKRIAIFAVELKKGKSLEKARSKQRNFIADRIKNANYDGAITAFYSEDPQENKWRLSFVRLDYEFLKGKVKTNFTPAKRYSYLVGSDEPCHTAMQQLYPILQEENFNPTLDKIEEAFSVEKVTKQFFEKYREKYFEIKEYLMSNDIFTEEASRCIKSDDKDDIEKFTEQFAKKLMGQIAFMYFLQKKGWMGVNAIPQTITESQFKNLFFYNALSKKFANDLYKKIAENEYRIVPSVLKRLSEDEELAVASSLKGKAWGDGPKDFVRKLYNDAVKNNKSYFDDYLEPLFYEALNEKRPANNYFTKLHCRIPFLNGGLFEPYYDWKNNSFSIPNYIFSNKDIKGERDADGILDIFDRYNFTMNEDEPLEKEVAVDPEMLGKIFENLLDAKDRKSKGAFYTPREIVHYMCQESLINYLVNTVGTPYEDTKDFILYGEIMKDEDCSREVKQGVANMLMPDSIYSKLSDIDKALADVRVADPAVGSGAFPMGMINEIVKARDVITDYRAREIEIDGKKKGISDKQINFLKANEHNLRNLYSLKKDAMFNSIYAVDIEPSAVDIAKLRLWLSLVVEFEVSADEPNPPTLPNLDCHIICGNSLIDEFEGVQLFDPSILNSFGDLISSSYSGLFERLYELERKFFYAQNHSEKYEYRNKIEEIKLSIMQSALAGCSNETKERFLATRNMPSKPYTLWQLEFSKVFKEKGGFDIVIGNPPYVGQKGANDIFIPVKETAFGKKFHQRRMDFFYFFFHKGIDLLKNDGILSFITTNYFLTATYGDKLRADFKNRTHILGIINFNELKIFETALGQHNAITMLCKGKNEEFVAKFISSSKKGFFNNEISNILNYSSKDCIVSNIKNKDIYEGNINYIRYQITESSNADIISKVKNNGICLSRYFELVEGIHTGADSLSNSHIQKYNIEGVKGEGIYILDNNSFELKKFSETSKEIIKKWYKNSDIERWITHPSHLNLIYYTTKTELGKYVDIEQHLSKYKSILINRNSRSGTGIITSERYDSFVEGKENLSYVMNMTAFKNGNFYAISYPREQRVFESEKIICPQRSTKNTFAYNNGPFYASADVYFIVNKDPSINIKYLLALLNSKLYYYWLYNQGKLKGAMLELYIKPLSEIPIKPISKEEQMPYIDLVDKILLTKQSNTEADVSLYETELNNMVYKLYGLTTEEISIIESNK